MSKKSGSGNRNAPLMIALRVLIAAALIIDAVIHLQLASNYQMAAPGGIGQGNLFRIQSAAAILAAVYLLVRGSRPAYAIAAVVALSAFAAVVLYRYVDVPAIGPIPAMYEPIWYFEKTLTAVAEGVGGVLAVIGFAVVGKGGKRPRGRGAGARQ